MKRLLFTLAMLLLLGMAVGALCQDQRKNSSLSLTTTIGMSSTQTLVSDTFHRADGALGNNWVGSTWTISNYQAVNTPTLSAEMLTDGDMETPGVDNWGAGYSDVAKVSDERTGGTGTSALEVTSKNDSFLQTYQKLFSQTIGDFYRTSIWMKHGTAPIPQLNFQDDSGNLFAYGYTANATWTYAALTGRLAETTTIRFAPYDGNVTAAGQTDRFDDASVKKITFASMFAFQKLLFTNVDVSVQITTPQNPYSLQAGLVVSADSPTTLRNLVIVYLDGHGKITVDKGIWDGSKIVWTNVLSATSFSYYAGMQLRVTKSGSTYKVYYNGSQVGGNLTISDAAIVSNQYHGLYSTGNPTEVQFGGFQLMKLETAPSTLAGALLTPVDYMPCRWLGTDGTYIYGLDKNSTGGNYKLVRTTNRTVDPTVACDFAPFGSGMEPSTVWSPYPGLLFVAAVDTNAKSYLFKSIDNGQHFGANAPTYDDGNPVLYFGDIGGGNQITSVGPLGDMSFCYDSINGQLLVGEYNVHADVDRTPGSTNDQVRLMKSSSVGATAGDTWTEVAHWNTDGSHHNTRHIHCVKQDPYTGQIYIAFGDPEVANCAGVIRWDGVSVLTSNQNISSYPYVCRSDSPYIAGQTVDMMILNNKLLWGSDVGSSGGGGFYTCSKDLQSYYKVGVINTYSTGQGVGHQIKTSTGTLLAVCYDAASASPCPIWTSGDNGLSWTVTGIRNYATAISSMDAGCFAFKGEIYISQISDGKVDTFQTYIFSEGGPGSFVSGAQVVAPVYWVNTTSGVDAAPTIGAYHNKGYRPDCPYRTLAYAQAHAPSGAWLIVDGVGQVNP